MAPVAKYLNYPNAVGYSVIDLSAANGFCTADGVPKGGLGTFCPGIGSTVETQFNANDSGCGRRLKCRYQRHRLPAPFRGRQGRRQRRHDAGVPTIYQGRAPGRTYDDQDVKAWVDSLAG